MKPTSQLTISVNGSNTFCNFLQEQLLAKGYEWVNGLKSVMNLDVRPNSGIRLIIDTDTGLLYWTGRDGLERPISMNEFFALPSPHKKIDIDGITGTVTRERVAFDYPAQSLTLNQLERLREAIIHRMQ